LLLVPLIGVILLLGLPVGSLDGPTEPTLKAVVVTKGKEPLPSQVQPSEPCTHLGLFQRERCLWTQCKTDRYRSHAVCARFR
jgi:hypothetical protein